MNSTVPAPTYPTALAASTAALPIAARRCGVIPGPGASSRTFRFRRCAEPFPGTGEVGVLGQETVPRMARLRTGLSGGFQDAVGDQIRLTRRGRPDQDRFVGKPYMARVGVGFRVHGDGAHAEASRGLDDA